MIYTQSSVFDLEILMYLSIPSGMQYQQLKVDEVTTDAASHGEPKARASSPW